MSTIFHFIIISLIPCITFAIRIDQLRIGDKGGLLGMLRAMENQTTADSLNLPANATTIRENIVDTFSCEKRTYGYYADVDNECQVFHVCLPTRSASGRNVTYRWSFICPNETMFSQDLLTCARSRDSINCDESEMYYYLNEEMYKTNDTNAQSEYTTQPNNYDVTHNADVTTPNYSRNRKRPMKKQNLIFNDNVKDTGNERLIQLYEKEYENLNKEPKQMMEGVSNMDSEVTMNDDDGELTNVRLIGERKKRNSRKLKRRTFRFKADV